MPSRRSTSDRAQARLRDLLVVVAALSTLACSGEPPVEVLPQQLSPSSFEYPEELWDAGVEGITTLRIFIDTAGAADSARVEGPSGYAAFDSSAIRGSRKLRFEPAKRAGQPVARWFLLPVEFRIPGADRTRSSSMRDSAHQPPSIQ